jgi:hypothetical protein
MRTSTTVLLGHAATAACASTVCARFSVNAGMAGQAITAMIGQGRLPSMRKFLRTLLLWRASLRSWSLDWRLCSTFLPLL